MQTNLNVLVFVLGLSILRPLGIFLLSPIFSTQSLGSTIARNGLLLLLSIPVLPLHLGAEFIADIDLSTLVGLTVKEVFVGMMLGFSSTLSFWAIDIASFLLDTMRGASMSTLLNPLLGEASSVLGLFFSQLVSVLFLSLGGFEKLLYALYISYELLPIQKSLAFDAATLDFIRISWKLLFELALTFAAPAAVIMVLTDVGLGLISRSAQQLNVFFLAMPIKSALMLLMMILTLSFSLKMYIEHIQDFAQPFLSYLKSHSYE